MYNDYFYKQNCMSAAHCAGTENSIEKMILEELKIQNISFLKLAAMLNVDRTHLTRCLKMTGGEKRKLSDNLKKRIEEVLGREFPSAPPSSEQTDSPENADT